MPGDDARAAGAVGAIRAGDVAALERLLAEHPELATARLTDARGHERTLLHVVTDWPGHFPNGAETVAALVAAGADTSAAFGGPHAETPLHWAASSDDVEVLDALVAAGADVDAPGSVIDGGGPLADAVAFGQWRAARRLIDHGARANLWQAAGLGLMDRLEGLLAEGTDAGRDHRGLLVRVPRRAARGGGAPARSRRRPRLGRLRRPHAARRRRALRGVRARGLAPLARRPLEAPVCAGRVASCSSGRWSPGGARGRRAPCP